MRRAVIALFCTAWALAAHAEDPAVSELEASARQRRDPGVYYNLGVLYARAGETGKSVLNFKRASLLDPSDREARDNLNVLRQAIGMPPYLFELNPVEQIVSKPFSVLSLNASAALGLVLLALGSATLSISFLRFLSLRKTKSPRFARIIGTVLASAGIVYLSASVIRYRMVFDRASAVVIRDSNLLERPDASSTTIAELSGGLECRINRGESGYKMVSTSDGRVGWIRSSDVEVLWE